jgi:hypothetical protein
LPVGLPLGDDAKSFRQWRLPCLRHFWAAACSYYVLSSQFSSWSAELVSVLAERFTLVLFDNRGTGLSDKPKSGYALSNMTDDVIGLIDHLAIHHGYVLGYSMGGDFAGLGVSSPGSRVVARPIRDSLRRTPDRLCGTGCYEFDARFGRDDAGRGCAPHLDGHI